MDQATLSFINDGRKQQKLEDIGFLMDKEKWDIYRAMDTLGVSNQDERDFFITYFDAMPRA